MKKLHLAVFSAALFMFLSLSLSASAQEKSDGKHKVVYRTFVVKDFAALDLSGAMKVVYTQGPLSVKAKAPVEEMSLLKLKQKQGRLSASVESANIRLRNRTHIVLYVSAPKLTDLTLSGATDFYCKELHTDVFDLQLSGASEADFESFEAQELKAGLSGASEMKIRGKAVKSNFVCSGSSELSLHLSGNVLNVSNSGASDTDIDFNGGNVDVQASGSSDVKMILNCRQVSINASGASDVVATGVAPKHFVKKSGASSVDVKSLRNK